MPIVRTVAVVVGLALLALTQLSSIYQKLGVPNRAAAAFWAGQHLARQG